MRIVSLSPLGWQWPSPTESDRTPSQTKRIFFGNILVMMTLMMRRRRKRRMKMTFDYIAAALLLQTWQDQGQHSQE